MKNIVISWRFWLAAVLASVVLSWLVERTYISGGMPLAQELAWPQWLQRAQQARQAQVFLGESHAVLQDEQGQALTRLPLYDPAWLQQLKALGTLQLQPMTVLPGHHLWVGAAQLLPWLVMVAAALNLVANHWPRRQQKTSPESESAFGEGARVQNLQIQGGPKLEDLAGVERIRQELDEVLEGLLHPQRFTSLGIEPPRGVLLYGPPGTGKTLLARAMAAQAQVPCFALAGSAFVEMYVGVGAARVRELFAHARAHAPCIVFIDELDAIGTQRSEGNTEHAHALNQLLVELDGLSGRGDILVLAATNRAQDLDPALKRPGRFDRQIEVGLPNAHQRQAILAKLLGSMQVEPGVALQALAQRTVGFSPAQLRQLVHEAALLALRQQAQRIGWQHLAAAQEKILLGLRREGRPSEQERHWLAWHECGHAVVNAVLRPGQPVYRLSIAQTSAAAGFALAAGDERTVKSDEDLLRELAVLLAGRVCEEMFGAIKTTAAESDLQQATELAIRMARTLGFEAWEQLVGDALETQSHREALTSRASAYLEQACERAKEVLRQHDAALRQLHARLLAEETITDWTLTTAPAHVQAPSADASAPSQA
ncbi:MAG: AAA family ATPase [Halomonas sp.]|nr:AAA family ATPase [Halomonas sp.]